MMTSTTLNALSRGGSYESLDHLRSQLREMQLTKRDYIVDPRSMTFNTAVDEDGNPGGSSLIWDSAGGLEGGPVNDHAHGQISAKLQIPKRYYDRMRTDAPDLLDRNVGHWLARNETPGMIRMLDGTVRAFLSERYRRLDNIDLVERAVVPALQGIEGIQFLAADVTPERLYLRCLLPRVEQEIKVGDIVQAGFTIKNSEVGMSKLSIDPFAWRLECKNGMVRSAGQFSSRHVGRREEANEDTTIYQADTIRAADKAYWMEARDAIVAALDEARFAVWADEMRAAISDVRISNPVAATKQLAQTFELTDDEEQAVYEELLTGRDLTRWGLVNAVTATAKGAASFDRQDELEQIGDGVLQLAGRDWDRFAFAGQSA